MNIQTLSTKIQELKEKTPLLTNILDEARPFLLVQQETIQSVDLPSIQKQLQMMRFLFVTYNTDIWAWFKNS